MNWFPARKVVTIGCHVPCHVPPIAAARCWDLADGDACRCVATWSQQRPPPNPFHFAYSAPCPKRCWTLLLLFLRVPFHLLPLHPPDYPPVRTPSSHVSPQEVRPVDKNGGYKHCGASFGIQGIVVRSTRAHMGARASRQTRGGSTTTSWQSTTAPEPSNPRTACACTRTTMFCQLPALLAPTEPLTCAVS